MKLRVLLIAFLLTASCSHFSSYEEKLLKRSTDAVVAVMTDDSLGSGSVILSDSARTLVLTNFHVIDGAKGVWICYGKFRKPAQVESFDPDKDLALLSTGTTGLPALALASTEPKMYERFYVIGNHLGMEDTVADALLTSTGSSPPGSDRLLLRFTGFFIYGVSGGAVINKSGELVAVPEIIQVYLSPVLAMGQETPLNAVTPITQVGYAIPMADVREFLKHYSL